MPSETSQLLGNFFNSIHWVTLVIQVILHFIFASSVAKDAGLIMKKGRTTWLVSGMTWALATLIGGVFVAAIYWFIHYSNIMQKKN
jgi:hypothetical protein